MSDFLDIFSLKGKKVVITGGGGILSFSNVIFTP